MKYLFGASGHAKVIIEIIKSTKQSKIDGVFDDYKNLKSFFKLPFLGKFKDYKQKPNTKIVVSIGDNLVRKNIVNTLNINFFTAIHSTAKISESCSIKEGTVVMSNAVINAEVRIGKHCIINTSSIIEHECIIEDFVHISPNATITGNVTIGEGTHVGAGAIIIPNITIGKWCVIGAGAVVIDSLPDYSLAVGNPAKIIKQNKI